MNHRVQSYREIASWKQRAIPFLKENEAWNNLFWQIIQKMEKSVIKGWLGNVFCQGSISLAAMHTPSNYLLLSQGNLNAIEALANARRVEFYAFGGSAPVAMDAQHKFFRLKIPSSYISDPHIQFMSANSLGDKDVVVAISQSGTTSALIDSVNIVRKSGVKVIGIMPANTPLANICDLPLSIDVGDNNRLSKPHTSRIAYTAVIDVMTMGVAQLKPEAQEHLYNIADSQRSLRVK